MQYGKTLCNLSYFKFLRWENSRAFYGNGSSGTASLFTQISSLAEGRPIEFLLNEVERIGDGKMSDQTIVKLNNGVEMPMAGIGTFVNDVICCDV